MRAAKVVEGLEGGFVYTDCMGDVAWHRRVIVENLRKVVSVLGQIVFSAAGILLS